MVGDAHVIDRLPDLLGIVWGDGRHELPHGSDDRLGEPAVPGLDVERARALEGAVLRAQPDPLPGTAGPDHAVGAARRERGNQHLVAALLGCQGQHQTAETLALGLMSLCDGVQFFRMCDPQQVTEEVTETVLAGFFSRVILG